MDRRLLDILRIRRYVDTVAATPFRLLLLLPLLLLLLLLLFLLLLLLLLLLATAAALDITRFLNAVLLTNWLLF